MYLDWEKKNLLPKVYSSDLSEFIFAAAVEIFEKRKN